MFIRSQRADVNKGNTLCFPPSLQALLTPLKRLYAKYFNTNPSRIDKRGFTRQHKALWTLWGAYLNTKKLSYSSSRPPIMALLIADLISCSDVFFFFSFSAVLLLMCHCTSVINLTSAPLVANYYLAWLSPWKGLINPFTSAVPVFTFGSDPKAILGLHNQDQFKKTKKNYCCCTDRTSEHTELFNSVFSGSARTEGCRRCVTVGSPSWAASRRIQYSIRTIISKVD